MNDASPPDDALYFLAGAGEAATLMRATDWSRTPLGPAQTWPQSLRTMVATLLNSRHPMVLWWGPSLIQFYNDAYIPSFGRGKHPQAMGQRCADCWQEAWPLVGPQVDDVMNHGIASWNQDHLVPVFRNGRIEDCYWTYGFSPVLAEGGVIGGSLVVCSETTSRVVAQRRQTVVRDLSKALAHASLHGDIPELTMHGLRGASIDVPACVYCRWSDKQRAPTELASGRAQDDESPRADGALSNDVPDAILTALNELPRRAPTDFEALWVGAPILLSAVVELPSPGGPEPITDLLLTPVRGAESGALEFVAFGLNPRIPFDADYRQFLIQLSVNVSLATTRFDAAQAGRLKAAEQFAAMQSLERANAELAHLLEQVRLRPQPHDPSRSQAGS